MSRTPLFDDDADRVLALYRQANAALTDQPVDEPADTHAEPQPDPRVRRTVLAVAARQLREVAPAQQLGAPRQPAASATVRWLRWPKLPVWGNALAATLMVGVLVVAVTPRVQEEAGSKHAAGDLNVPTASSAPAVPPAPAAERTADAAQSAAGTAAVTEAAAAATAATERPAAADTLPAPLAAAPSALATRPNPDGAAAPPQRSARIAAEPAPPIVLPRAPPAPTAAAMQDRADAATRSAPPAAVPQPAPQAAVVAAAPPPAASPASAESAGSMRSKSVPAPDPARADTAPAAALLAKPRAQTADAANAAGPTQGGVSDAARRSPDRWAEAIRTLLRAGQTEAARAELSRLQAAYPAWPLPEDLRKLAQTAPVR